MWRLIRTYQGVAKRCANFQILVCQRWMHPDYDCSWQWSVIGVLTTEVFWSPSSTVPHTTLAFQNHTNKICRKRRYQKVPRIYFDALLFQPFPWGDGDTTLFESEANVGPPKEESGGVDSKDGPQKVHWITQWWWDNLTEDFQKREDTRNAHIREMQRRANI